MLVFGLAAALTLGPPPTEPRDAGEAIELHWSAPAGCPDGEQARALVDALVPSTEARLRVRASIDAVAGSFEGTLELHTNASRVTRRLQTDDCMMIARAMAVVIAVSLDPLATAEQERVMAVPEPVPEPVGPTLPAGAGERARSSTRETTPRSTPAELGAGDQSPAEPRPTRRVVEGGVRIGAGMGGLLLPAAGMGLSLAPFVGTARLHVRAVAQYWVPQELAFDPRRDARGELQLITGGVRVCPPLAWGRVRVPLCAGADAGAMLGRGTGRDLVPRRTAREPWAGVVLEPGVTVGVTSRVSLWLALEGVVSLYRPSFAVEGAAQDWTSGAGALRGLLGVEVHARRDRPQNP